MKAYHGYFTRPSDSLKYTPRQSDLVIRTSSGSGLLGFDVGLDLLHCIRSLGLVVLGINCVCEYGWYSYAKGLCTVLTGALFGLARRTALLLGGSLAISILFLGSTLARSLLRSI